MARRKVTKPLRYQDSPIQRNLSVDKAKIDTTANSRVSESNKNPNFVQTKAEIGNSSFKTPSKLVLGDFIDDNAIIPVKLSNRSAMASKNSVSEGLKDVLPETKEPDLVVDSLKPVERFITTDVNDELNLCVEDANIDSTVIPESSQCEHKTVDPVVDMDKGAIGPHSKSVTWKNKLFPTAKGLSLSLITQNSSDYVDIELNDVQDEILYWQHTLVGSFFGGNPPFTVVKDFVAKHWNCVSIPEVLQIKKGWYYFRFSTEEDKTTILKGGPWVLDKANLLLKAWTPSAAPTVDSSSLVPVWIRLYGLDPVFWSFSSLSKIVSKIGKPLFTDATTAAKSRITFARILVEIDVAAPLPEFITIRSPFGGPIEQPIFYEWIPYYCSTCCVLGHDTNHCWKNRKPKDTNMVPPNTKDTQPSENTKDPNKWIWQVKTKSVPTLESGPEQVVLIDPVTSSNDNEEALSGYEIGECSKNSEVVGLNGFDPSSSRIDLVRQLDNSFPYHDPAVKEPPECEKLMMERGRASQGVT